MATKQFIGNVRGQKGDQGVSITSVKQTTTSDIDGGINEITVTLSDGRKEAFQVANGNTGKKGDQGVSVKTVAQTTTSNADGGSNVMTVTLSDGTQAKFTVKNGNKGDKGDKGDTGDLSEECADARTSATGKSYDDLKARLDVEYNFLDTKANCIEGETSGDTITDSANAPLAYMKNNGYTKQDGIPTPDAPIEIKGLGDSGTIGVKTCGNNLLSHSITTKTEKGLTITHNVDDSLTISGTATEYKTYNCDNIINRLKVGQTYVWNDVIHVQVIENGTTSWLGSSGEYTITDKTTQFLPFYEFTTNETVNTTYYPMVRLKGTDDTYEPYTETQALIPISSPLYEGDYIEVYADGSGQIVRENYKITLDGSRTIDIIFELTNCVRVEFVHGQVGKNTYENNSYSTHLTENISYTLDAEHIYTNDKRCYIFLAKERLSSNDLDGVKDYLNNNNIDVVFKLATPTTEPLTAEQVAEFMKLRTYKTTTHINADGEKVVRYVVDTKTYIDNKFAELQALMNV